MKVKQQGFPVQVKEILSKKDSFFPQIDSDKEYGSLKNSPDLHGRYVAKKRGISLREGGDYQSKLSDVLRDDFIDLTAISSNKQGDLLRSKPSGSSSLKKRPSQTI